ncbi:MAG: helix-turn-helix domain-containing protein [Pirellulaceae bacterium]|nr:helix-turn-helix domain-containing protein [Pirellulaceae bacterium]
MAEKLGEYLTIKQAAQFLAVSPNTLRNWGRTGKIGMHRHPVNGYRLFRREELQHLLDVASEPETPNAAKPR